MEVKTTIASAFIDIVSQESSLNHEDTKFLHKTILSFIKLVRQDPNSRGDLTIALLPLYHLRNVPSSWQKFISALLDDTKGQQISSFEEQLKNKLEGSEFPLSKCWLERQTLVLSFNRSFVMEKVLSLEFTEKIGSFLQSKSHLPHLDLEISAPSCNKLDVDLSSYRSAVVAHCVDSLVRITLGNSSIQPNEECKGKNKSSITDNPQGESLANNGKKLTVSSRTSKKAGVLSVSHVMGTDEKKIFNYSAADAQKRLQEELRVASAHKQSAETSDEELCQQSLSCLRLVLSSANVSSPIVFQWDGNVEEGFNSRRPAFILYNYSRLKTLLGTHAALVRRGDIPSSSANSLSFHLLSQPEEWELVWCYISHWPDILLTLLQQIQAFSTSESSSGNPSESHPKNPSQSHPENPSQSHPKNIIQIHLVGKFLQDLCRCFSGYYNRVRLLPAVSASALPEQVRETMHVRVRLLRALLATMDSAFSIIGVEPLSYM